MRDGMFPHWRPQRLAVAGLEDANLCQHLHGRFPGDVLQQVVPGDDPGDDLPGGKPPFHQAHGRLIDLCRGWHLLAYHLQREVVGPRVTAGQTTARRTRCLQVGELLVTFQQRSHGRESTGEHAGEAHLNFAFVAFCALHMRMPDFAGTILEVTARSAVGPWALGSVFRSNVFRVWSAAVGTLQRGQSYRSPYDPLLFPSCAGPDEVTAHPEAEQAHAPVASRYVSGGLASSCSGTFGNG